MTSKHKTYSGSHAISELFTFLLFAMFLVLSLLIVVIGADGYRGVVDTGEQTSALRTSFGYVAGKLRSEAASGGVEIRNVEGRSLLVLTENYENDIYETIIYHKDGALYEVYRDVSATEFSEELGERLAEVADFTFDWTDEGLLALTARDANNNAQTLRMSMRTAQGGRR